MKQAPMRVSSGTNVGETRIKSAVSESSNQISDKGKEFTWIHLASRSNSKREVKNEREYEQSLTRRTSTISSTAQV